VRVTVRNFRSFFRALLDTGFDGHLVLPEALGSQLGNPDQLIKTYLADGTERETPIYLGDVEMAGLGIVYPVPFILLGDECLMGQGIIRRLKVTFDHGNQIVIEL